MNRKQRRAKRKQPVKTNHSMNDAFGIGKDRLKIWAQKLKENTAEYARMSREVDADYANEKLRQRVSQVYGEEVSCLYEDELRGGRRT